MASPHPAGLVRALDYRRTWRWHIILLAVTIVLFGVSWVTDPPDLAGPRAYLYAVGDALGAL